MTTTATDPSTATADDLAERLMMAAVGMADLLAIHLGDRLGWYRVLAGHGALTADGLARRSGTEPRYAREWLEAQAVSGLLVASSGEGQERTYELTPAAREVLTDTTSLAYLAPLARLLAAAAAQLPALLDAYRTGHGVSWAQFGPDARTGQADMNRPWYDRVLADALAGVPSMHGRLRAAGALVEGYDIDAPSTAAAVAHAEDAGLGDRVGFTTGDAAALLPHDTHDAVFAFECLHDLPHPVAALARCDGR